MRYCITRQTFNKNVNMGEELTRKDCSLIVDLNYIRNLYEAELFDEFIWMYSQNANI